MKLSLTKIAKALLADSVSYKLILHVFEVQQFKLAHLDYEEAAKKVGTSERTVGRTVKKLAEKGVFIVERDKLKISEDFQL